jgi:hypothetical protein
MMPYSKFESVEKVAEKFDIEVKNKPFIDQIEIQISESHFSRLHIKSSTRTDRRFNGNYSYLQYYQQRVNDLKFPTLSHFLGADYHVIQRIQRLW